MKSLNIFIIEILYLLGKDKKIVLKLLISFILLSIFELIGISLIVPYISIIANPSLLNPIFLIKVQSLFHTKDINQLYLILGCILLLVFFLKSVSSILINKSILTFVEKKQLELRSKILTAYQNLDYTEYLNRNSSEYIQVIQSQVATFSNNVLLSSLKMLSEGILVSVILILLAISNGKVLLLLTIIFIFFIFFYDYFFKNKINYYGKQASVAGKKMIQGIQESLEGFKEIKILGKEKFFHEKMVNGAKELSENGVKSQLINTSPRYMMEFVIVFFVVLVVSLNILFNKNVVEIVSTLGLFGVASLRLMPSINLLSNSLSQIRFGRDATKKLYLELLKIEQYHSISDITVKNKSQENIFNELNVKNLSFKYPNSINYILNDVSFYIKRGESIGIIGASGSGKTTLMDILLGLLKPTNGKIYYNNLDLVDHMLDWRNQIAYLPQNVFLIDSSLMENIALGESIKEIDEDNILVSLEKAQLFQLYKQMQNGLETMLGERGIRLSGGQRQRIALARAFYYKKNILIMDESTSSLDNETERLIVEEIDRFKGQKTIVVIAHRYTTVKKCDRIYKITENGNIENVTNLIKNQY
jgi:ABC-type multidrug transport system fused ATPase/permease subunit